MKKEIMSAPRSFWVICILGLLWNLGGSANYLMQTDPEFVVTLPETHRAIIVGRPIWATAGFAIGVFGGALGCLLLLLRRALAYQLFIVSLLGIAVTMIHTILIAISTMSFSLFEIVMMIVLPLIVAKFLLWYAHQAICRHWVN